MGGEASLFHSIETRGIFLAGRRPLLSSMLIGKFVHPQPPAQSFFRLPDSCPEDKAVGGTRKVFPSCGQQFFPGSGKFFLGSRYTYVREEEGKVGRKVVVFEHVLPLKRDKKRHRSLALFFPLVFPPPLAQYIWSPPPLFRTIFNSINGQNGNRKRGRVGDREAKTLPLPPASPKRMHRH